MASYPLSPVRSASPITNKNEEPKNNRFRFLGFAKLNKVSATDVEAAAEIFAKRLARKYYGGYVRSLRRVSLDRGNPLQNFSAFFCDANGYGEGYEFCVSQLD